VVDPAAADYELWLKNATARSVQFHLLARGSDALRAAAAEAIDLWVVSAELPDMAGTDLCQMLRSRGSRAAVYLVSNDHSEHQERAAYQCGASMYGVKPAHLEWLDEWLSHRSLGECSLR
jgi:DNA-binding response OmpR family regulator